MHPPLPPRPEPPDPRECCDSGCTPCIFTLYEEALAQWKLAIKAATTADATAGSTSSAPPP